MCRSALIQDVLDGRAQIVHGERFLQEGIDALAQRVFLGDHMAEAGAQNDWDIGPYLAERLRQRFAGHVWHGLICNHQVKRMGCGEKARERLIAAGVGRDVIAEVSEHRLPCANQSRFIVDKEDIAPASWRLHGRLAIFRICFLPLWQINRELRPTTRLTLDRDCAVVMRNDAMDNGKAHAGALTDRFGGKEGVKNSRLHIGRDALTGIAHGETDVRTGAQGGMVRGQNGIDLNCFQTDLQPTAVLAHGMLGIGT